MSLIKVKIKNNKKKVYFCGLQVYSGHLFQNKERKTELNNKLENCLSELTNLYNVLSQQNEKLDHLRYIVLPAMATHPKVFSKYKNYYKGKDIVLVASGPSSNNYVPIKGAVHVGVNSAYRLNTIKLDYLFVQDRFPTISSDKDTITHYDCQKFYGIHYMQPANEPSSSISQDDLVNEEQTYYFENFPTILSDINFMSADITTRPLMTWGSVSFCALEFILWTHPKRIYLVGCDNTTLGHFDKETDGFQRDIDMESAVKYTHDGWKLFKIFAQKHYPDTEIISVNPVGLKGIFNDIYQKEEI